MDEATKKQRTKENRRALRDLVNPSALIFFGILFGGGAMWGIHDTYLLIYLQNDLGASSQFIGYFNTLGHLTPLLVLPFAKWIIEYIGNINLLYSSVIGECLRMLVFSWIHQSPPNYAYGLILLNFWISALYWTTAMKYSHTIAPPQYVGTMAAMSASVNWIICKILLYLYNTFNCLLKALCILTSVLK